jgi:hypothetical protein
MGHKLDDCPKLVSEFIISGGGGWGEQIRHYFLDDDVDDILRIPIDKVGLSDYQALNFIKKGTFSVRSTYHLAVEPKNLARYKVESSRSCDEHKGWPLLWVSKRAFSRLNKNGLTVSNYWPP